MGKRVCVPILTCCFRLIEVCNPQNLHHTYTRRLIFHQTAHGNFNVLQKTPRLYKVCLHSSKPTGQMRTDVAPEWIIWSEKTSTKWTIWRGMDFTKSFIPCQGFVVDWAGRGERKKERKKEVSLCDLLWCLAPLKCIWGQNFPMMV